MRVFLTIEIVRGRGWQGKGIGSDKGAEKEAREGMSRGGAHLTAVYPALFLPMYSAQRELGGSRRGKGALIRISQNLINQRRWVG